MCEGLRRSYELNCLGNDDSLDIYCNIENNMCLKIPLFPCSGTFDMESCRARCNPSCDGNPYNDASTKEECDLVRGEWYEFVGGGWQKQ